MKIVALHLAFPVDGMHVLPASVALIAEGAKGFVVTLGARVFAVPREACIVEGVEEPAVEPQPVTVPEVRELSTGHTSTRALDTERASGIRIDPNVKRRR